MALYNIISTILVAGINFITIPIFTRMLNTDGYGVVSVYTAWVQICSVFVGLKADGSIGSAKANLPEEEQDSYHMSILMLGITMFVPMFALVILFLQPLSSLLGMSPVLTVCMVFQSLGAFLVSVFTMRFIFEKRAQCNLVLSVGLCLATTILSILFILYLYVGQDGYLGRVLGLTVPNFIIGVSLVLALAISKHPAVRIGYWRFCLALTLPLIFHGLSQILLAQVGKISIQQVYGDSLAGVYSIATTITQLLNYIYNALNNAFVPFMYDDLGGKTSENVKQSHFRNYFTSFTFGAMAFAFISPEILKLMSTEAYWDAIPLLPILAFGQYCIFLYSFPVNFEFFKMRTRSLAIGTVAAAVLDVVLTALFAPRFGMAGAAFATTISYLALFLFHFFVARYLLGDRNYPARYFAYGIMLVAASCLACSVLLDALIVRWAFAIAFLICVAVRIIKTRTIF
jgi:O-antigen/teichoic acid export membrane protein